MSDINNMFLVFLAGASGAFIGITNKRINWTLLQRITYFISGCLVAFWISPFICKQLNMLESEEISVVAFASGLFWYGLVSRLRKLIDNVITNARAAHKK
ncbi:hypothetical protein KCK33_003522 [Salmonella enterica]|nr:hypothetical protein [Salmonella enterica]EGA0603431.1 hypothetical protein [Salmonella enterica]EHD2148901.1 hypothetical protein [Salmonella enterica]EHK2353390.1 hypothetical protein [Salmonella enterica]